MNRITITTHEPIELIVNGHPVAIMPIRKARPRAPYLALVRPVVETEGVETAALKAVG